MQLTVFVFLLTFNVLDVYYYRCTTRNNYIVYNIMRFRNYEHFVFLLFVKLIINNIIYSQRQTTESVIVCNHL